MTCSECGCDTLGPGVCVDCSRKRFDDYPALKALNQKLLDENQKLKAENEELKRHEFPTINKNNQGTWNMITYGYIIQGMLAKNPKLQYGEAMTRAERLVTKLYEPIELNKKLQQENESLRQLKQRVEELKKKADLWDEHDVEYCVKDKSRPFGNFEIANIQSEELTDP